MIFIVSKIYLNSLKSPTPLTNNRFVQSFGKIVNGTEAGVNWPFIVRMKVSKYI